MFPTLKPYQTGEERRGLTGRKGEKSSDEY